MNKLHDSEVGNEPLSYELIELGELERGTGESAAVKAAFGEPNQGVPLDRSTLPLVIVGYDPRRLAKILIDQRTHPETSVRPIALAGIQAATDAPVVDQLADWVLAPYAPTSRLISARDALLRLSKRLQQIPLVEEDGALRLLQFLESRGQPLQPVLVPAARMAYRYPVAEQILGASVPQVLELLTDMSRYGLFNCTTVDRVYVCPDCSSYRLPVKELCPECQSPNISMETSLHHFRCGYMAPESLFMQHGHPVCPKCYYELRHVGVEYNRPGQLVVCGACGFWAAEPKLRAWCVECNRLHTPEQLKSVRFHRFALTLTARRVARSGSWRVGTSKIQPTPTIPEW